MNNGLEASRKLFETTRSVSKDILEQHSVSLSFDIKELQKTRLECVEEIACILMLGDSIRLFFKAHFWIDDAKTLAEKKYHLEKKHIQQNEALDFMKEYCNIVSGKIKYGLKTMNFDVGQSLPIALGGYQEIFFQDHKKPDFVDSWELCCNDISVYCSLYVNFLNPNLVQTLATHQGPIDVTPNEVELF